MRTRTRCSIRPSLECLEVRDTPAGMTTATLINTDMTLVEAQTATATQVGAGTVTATFTGGRLPLNGDAADNSLLIYQADDGRLILTGYGSGTLIRLNGDAASGMVTLPAPVTGAVAINL